jgi:hypothetical protein
LARSGALAEAEAPGACLVDGPGGARLLLPRPGEDVCEALRAHCGGGRAGAMCVKAALEQVGGGLPADAATSRCCWRLRGASER